MRWFKAPVISMAWVRIPPLPFDFSHLTWNTGIGTIENVSFPTPTGETPTKIIFRRNAFR